MQMSGPRGFDYRWLRWRAMGLIVFGRNAAAEDTFDEMVQRWPEDAYALASRAHLRAQAGRRSQAIADMERVVALPEANAAHWFNLGFLLDEAERYDEAEPAFRKALELDPKLDRAWYGLGLVLIRQKRLDEAVAALERNTKLQPMSPYAWYQTRAAGGGPQDHPPPQGLRAQGGGTAGARNRARALSDLKENRLIPVCDWRQRDAIDGNAAPLLAEELEDHLASAGHMVRGDVRRGLFRPRPELHLLRVAVQLLGRCPGCADRLRAHHLVLCPLHEQAGPGTRRCRSGGMTWQA
jgi:tetratricopeptide (TPR) repeat protein